MATYILVLSCLSGVIAVVLACFWMESRYGELASKWMLSKEITHVVIAVGVLLVVILGGMKLLARVNRDLVMGISFAVGLSALWAAWWAVYSGRQHTGVVLFDIDQSDPKRIYVVAAFAVLAVGTLCGALMTKDVYLGLNSLFFLSTALMIHLIKNMKMLFSEKGIYTPNDFIAWDQIESYRWTGEGEKSHILVLHITHSLLSTKVLHIPWSYFEEVSDILEEYSDAHPSGDERVDAPDSQASLLTKP